MVRKFVMGGLAALTLGAGALVPSAASAADEGLALWYRFDETSGTVASDSSGNGRNGTLNGDASWGDGLQLGGANGYVKVPDNLMRGMTSITVALDVWIDSTQATPYFIYGFGNSSGSSGNGYLFTTGNTFRTSIASGNWSTEQNANAGVNLPRGGWQHIAYTLGGGVGVLYQNGDEVARNGAVTLTPGSIGGGTTTANYIGRSLYSGDKYLKGRVKDFRVYSRALSASEVAQLAGPVNAEIVKQDAAALDLGDTSAVRSDLTLPAKGASGSAITWASSDPSVVSATGSVTRPPAGEDDAHVTLTATLTKGTETVTKTFEVTVEAIYTDKRAVETDAAKLVVHNIDDVRGNLTLPTEGENGTTITWRSSKPDTLSETGEVDRPQPGDKAVKVNLKATISRGGFQAVRIFKPEVPALPAKEPYKGYLFAYFTGEGYSNGEQIYNALSKGNDPLHWQELNGGKPVLTSDVGEKGLRDPFVIRSPEGDRFYLIATDLKIYGNGDWDRAQRSGSRSIMVAESTDLVHWTNQRLVQVSPPEAGNTWAPEAYYDKTLGAYVVFWASKLYANPQHTGDTYNKMVYATTRDFYTFSEPKIWKDPGYSVIDSTVIEHNGTYYRFTKDERNNSSSSPCSKYIIEEKSTSLTDTNWDFLKECIGSGALSRGEGPTIFKSNTEDKWYLFIDEYGGRGYVPFESTDLEAGNWTVPADYQLPGRPRHGTVLGVTQAEYDRLLAAYGG